MTKWVAFAEAFPESPEASFEVLKSLNEEFIGKSVLLGNGLKLSEADIIVFSVIHSSLVCTLPSLSYFDFKTDDFLFLPLELVGWAFLVKKKNLGAIN